MGTAGFDPETLLTATNVVLDHWDRLATAEGRRAVVLEAVRQAVARNISSIVESIDWEVYVALVATGRGNSNDETRQLLAAELERAEIAFIGRMTDFYAAMCETLGLGLRDPSVSFRHLAAVGASVVEGLALRKVLVQANLKNAEHGYDGWSLADLLDDPIPGPAIDGGTADWTLAAWAFLAVFDATTEPIPNWEPTDARRSAVTELQSHAQAALGASEPS